MAEAVKKVVEVDQKKFPGYIETKLKDSDFISSVLKNWAQFPPEDIATLIVDAIKFDELEDSFLRSDGYTVEMNWGDGVPPFVTLIKLDEGKWVIPDMNFEDLEEFAEACEGNVE